MMHYSRGVLSFLALYFSLEETSAAVLPSKIKREVNWLDQEVIPRLSHHADMGDLSVGDRDADGRALLSESVMTPPESVQRYTLQNHKPSEKRRKLAPLDSIGRFQMKSFRNRNAA
ncbi:hypothetical protein OJAV_G00181980 [Oryzias javanicus]|uniref:Uncharacterized protein n=1 Tax=Oryzias javanicus TaxID=123683 RepID=A0A3S2M5P3_ORYJA|nr:hypothetical protein OJAV_G00181980 [Oryzias javanicus]